VRPACHLDDPRVRAKVSNRARRIVECLEPGITISLQEAGEVGQLLRRMIDVSHVGQLRIPARATKCFDVNRYMAEAIVFHVAREVLASDELERKAHPCENVRYCIARNAVGGLGRGSSFAYRGCIGARVLGRPSPIHVRWCPHAVRWPWPGYPRRARSCWPCLMPRNSACHRAEGQAIRVVARLPSSGGNPIARPGRRPPAAPCGAVRTAWQAALCRPSEGARR
jgi:hypothetical protein